LPRPARARPCAERQRAQRLRSELEEVTAQGNKVVIVTRTPGLDAFRARKSNDRNFDVFTLRAGRVVAIRACRDRGEAIAVAGFA
jgi:ketosteroid isomerase-like protein